MKWIALTLLVANIVLFVFEQRTNEQPSTPVASANKPRETGRIELLSEVSVGDQQRTLTDAISNPIRTEGIDGFREGACYGLGPFVDVFTGQDALEQLSALDVLGELRAIDEPTGESDYRVLIPPASSAEEAFRKLRELQASDIDSYVITEGQQSMGISLGVFSNLEGAQALLNQVGEMGYEPDVIEIRRQSRSYWIELSAGQFDQTSVKNWLVSRSELSGREMICTES